MEHSSEVSELAGAIASLVDTMDRLELQKSLYKVHKLLKAREDLLYILTEEQIGVIFSSLEKEKNIFLATSKPAKAAAKKKERLENTVSLMDLDF